MSTYEERNKKPQSDLLIAQISTARRLMDEGYSKVAIAEKMHLPLGAVNTLINAQIEIPEGDDNG